MRYYSLLIALIALLLVSTPGQVQSPNRAGLVIQLPDGRVETACVEFSETEISGVDLLNRSGLPVILDYGGGLGAKVCKIGETGCDYPGQDCWCQCQGFACAYWNYWQLRDGQWLYSPLGASVRRLGDGDVDGWAWGDGEGAPPPTSLGEICQVEVSPFASPLETPMAPPAANQPPPPTATSPASPLSLPTATDPDRLFPESTATEGEPAPSQSTPAVGLFAPGARGERPAPKTSTTDLPPSPDRYVGFAGVLAALGLVALTLYRRRTGV
jgi:MYXO-CTERM domain-containing protein